MRLASFQPLDTGNTEHGPPGVLRKAVGAYFVELEKSKIMTRYEPTSNATTIELLAKARRTNAQRTEIDHRHGAASPEDFTPAGHLRDAIMALITGLQINDKNCLAEGICMLQDLHSRLYDPVSEQEWFRNLPTNRRVLGKPKQT